MKQTRDKEINLIKLADTCNKLTSQWANYKIRGKVIEIKETKSKNTGSYYQLILFTDSSCTKTILNCTDLKVEELKDYDLVIRACKKNKYTETLFLTKAEPLINPLNLVKVLDYQSEWFNHVENLNLTLKSLSKIDPKIPSFDQDYTQSNLDQLATFEDEFGQLYYLRIWANDKPDYFDELVSESKWILKNITVNKAKGQQNARNLIKNQFTQIYAHPSN